MPTTELLILQIQVCRFDELESKSHCQSQSVGVHVSFGELDITHISSGANLNFDATTIRLYRLSKSKKTPWRYYGAIIAMGGCFFFEESQTPKTDARIVSQKEATIGDALVQRWGMCAERTARLQLCCLASVPAITVLPLPTHRDCAARRLWQACRQACQQACLWQACRQRSTAGDKVATPALVDCVAIVQLFVC